MQFQRMLSQFAHTYLPFLVRHRYCFHNRHFAFFQSLSFQERVIPIPIQTNRLVALHQDFFS